MWLLSQYGEVLMYSLVSGILGVLFFLEDILFGFNLFAWFVLLSYITLEFINFFVYNKIDE